jgi:radical SAM protein with 4Fe4S-binding SPASM domain
MCPRTYAMTRKCGYIDFEIFKKIIDQYLKDNPNATKYNRNIALHHFGESLLHPEFDKCISYMRKRRLLPSLSLNPLALTEEKAIRLVKSNPYLIGLSLDGYDEETFSTVRGIKGKWEETKHNTLVFLKLKQKFNPDMQVCVNIIHIPGNDKITQTVKDFWIKQPGVTHFYDKAFENFNGDVENINSFQDNSVAANNYKCTKPFELLTIVWDGTVVPCCFDYNVQYPLGNVQQENLIDIWNNKKMLALRKQFATGHITCALCKNCSSGGNYKATRSKAAGNPPLPIS